MPDVREGLRHGLAQALVAAGVDAPEGRIALERPRDRSHGDWASNVALVMARHARRPPRKLAEELAERLTANPPQHVEAVEAAGPGFLNFHLAPSWLHDVLREVLTAQESGYARSDIGAGQLASVEFVSANPTGPLHAGHGRWAAYGDSLCRLLQRCGYEVLREFYINDRGNQIDKFAESLAARSRGEEPPKDGYKGDYVIEWAKEMPVGAPVREWGVQHARRDQDTTLAAMNVTFDLLTSEAEMVARGAMDDVLAELRGRDAVYEHDGAVWLRASDYGKSADRVLIKSSGEPTYFLPDIAYHHEKCERADLVIDVLGSDHHDYVARMQAALKALGHDTVSYEVLVGQDVKVLRGGVEISLSKRSGSMVLVSQLLSDVGPDVTRLVYLLQSIDTTQTIDIDLVSAQSSENPVYYLQYAYARIHSLGRRAQAKGIERVELSDVDLSLLTHRRESEILRTLELLPDTVLGATRARAPHQITAWARNLAAAFHGFWHDCAILRDDIDPQLQQARLWLVEGTRVGLAVALGILGVSAPERL